MKNTLIKFQKWLHKIKDEDAEFLVDNDYEDIAIMFISEHNANMITPDNKDYQSTSLEDHVYDRIPRVEKTSLSQQSIRDEMDADMIASGTPEGEIESCLNHWNNKYMIQYIQKK